jgi:poly-gamma-glutamate capsule biosynthesis protein CapA/YwtB (metallophosphatase superfamily)
LFEEVLLCNMVVIALPLSVVEERQSFKRNRIVLPGALWLSALALPLLVLLGFALDSIRPTAPTLDKAPLAAPDSSVRISMAFVGDLMCHVPQMNCAKQADGSYDFTGTFDEITNALSAADFTIGNLETTTAGKRLPYGGYPAFNTPDAYIPALKKAGFDFLVTSNNHSMDTGEEGLLRTIDQLQLNGLPWTGTFRSQADRDSVRIVDLKGLRIGILNYTYGTNGAYPSANHKWMLNVADSALVTEDVVRARAQGAQLVLVFYHWGWENRAEPVAQQDTMFKYAVAAGADLVIGAHPHVVGPVEYFKTQNGAMLDSGLVAWSLGNFISNQYWRYTDAGVILNLELEYNPTTKKAKLLPAAFTPTWVYRNYSPQKKNYLILPANWCAKDSLPNWVDAESKRKMCEAYGDTKVMVRKRTTHVEER